MLVFTLENGEVFHIGNDIHIRVLGVKKGDIRVGIDAPRALAVDRDVVRKRKLKEADGVHSGERRAERPRAATGTPEIA